MTVGILTFLRGGANAEELMKLAEAVSSDAQTRREEAAKHAAKIEMEEGAREAWKEALAESDGPGALLAPERVSAFLLAGNARFTLVSKVTGARFTFRVRESRDEGDTRYFVQVLTGPCNETNYEFLGTVFDRKRFIHGRKSRISPSAPSARAFLWFAAAAFGRGVVPATCEVWHEGRCAKCGRTLTDPESIQTGLGPKCAGSE